LRKCRVDLLLLGLQCFQIIFPFGQLFLLRRDVLGQFVKLLLERVPLGLIDTGLLPEF
jgi:hypothetical protein